MRGYARGEFSTGLNPGHASGTIRVTPNLPEADPWIDQMDSNRLLVDLSYRPINTEKGSSIPVASNVEKVSAGVEAQIEMRGPGGHRRVKTATDQVKLQMGTLHNPINVSVSKSMMQLGSGPCLTIWSEHRIDDQQFNPG